LALGLLLFIALLLVLFAAGWAYLNSAAGEARLRGLALSAVEDALQGKVEVGRIGLSGRTVELVDLRLSTPEGEPVATLARVRAHLSLWPLLHHTLRIDSAELDRPVLTLVSDARGLNLSRALAPAHPSPSAPSQPSAWSVQLDRLTLKDGAVTFRQPGGTPQEIALESLGGSGSAYLGGGARGELRADLSLQGTMTDPLQGPVAVTLTARGEDGKTQLSVVLDGPGLALSAEATVRGSEKLDLKVSRLNLAPQAVRAVVPRYPLVVPLTLQGTLTRNGNWNTVALQGRAGSAKVTLDGTLDLALLEARELKLLADGVNLQQLTG
jgi:translocation and assembly module TamB